MRTFLAVLITLSTVILPPVVQASEQPIERFSLSNGMEVIVLPNHRVPAVNHMIWYRVGAADDPPGQSGLAHYHEHLMFKGSPNLADGAYSATIDKNGGEYNAFTGRDATSYHVTIAKDRLPLVMSLEAKRMQGLTVLEEAARKERQVVIEERKQRIENDPASLLAEQMNAALFRNHPYRLPTIGWQEEIETLTRADVLAFHQHYYHPNNAVLIISGDVTAAEVKPLAEKYYGAFKRAPLPPRNWQHEPTQRGARHITLRHPHVTQAVLSRLYAAPSVGYGRKEQALPLLVFSHLLGGGKNSFLYRKLVVEERVASSVDVSYNPYNIGPGMFEIELVPEKNITLERLETALDAAIQKLLSEGPKTEDLERTKRFMQAEQIYAREGLSDLAHLMGWMVMSGLPADAFNAWTTQIEAVTLPALQDTATSVLMRDASVTGYLMPEATP